MLNNSTSLVKPNYHLDSKKYTKWCLVLSSSKNKINDFNGLQSQMTGSIPVSPTISTKIKYVRNNKGLACKPLNLFIYFNCLVRRWSEYTLIIICKIRSKIGVFAPQIVCKSLLGIFQPIPKLDRVHRVRPKNSLFYKQMYFI